MMVVSVTYIHRLTLYRSHTHVLCCVAGRVYVIKPWEKGNRHEIHLDEMIQIYVAGSDIVYCRF